MIEFEHVSKTYATANFASLNDVSFTVEAGDLVVLIGTSGCGKTTALKLINRLVEPTSGRVLVDGQDVAQQEPVQLRRRIGYVIQQIGLMPHMTVAQNVGLVPRLLNWSESRRQARVSELLELVGLPPDTYHNRYPRELSGGQQQRVGVARALASDPTIVLMDEPFGAVDPITRHGLQLEMRKIQSTVRKTIVFVTHDIAEAFLLGDRIGVMRAGQLLQLATPEELLRQPADDYVAQFVGADGPWRKLEFLRVSDVASPLRCTAAPDWAFAHALQMMEQYAVDHLLVVRQDSQLLGHVWQENLRARRDSGTLADALLPTHTIPAATSLREALARLTREHDMLLAVNDETGRLTGTISTNNLLTLFSEFSRVEPASHE